MQYHVQNLNKFILIKWLGDPTLEEEFIKAVISTNKWKMYGWKVGSIDMYSRETGLLDG